jgi:ribonuclease BN (tRNA processing enzyme)
MKVRVLGCSGAIAKDCRTTSFLVDGRILVDAGTGVGDLTLEEMRGVSDLLLTHAHLDHIAALPLMLDAVGVSRPLPLRVHALPETIRALRDHVFNDLIWPDFTRLPTVQKPFLEFHPIGIGDRLEVAGCKALVLPAVHTVPAVAYALSGPLNRCWVFSGDTGPNPAFWKEVQRLDVGLLVIETAFSSRESRLARESLHLSPEVLVEQLDEISPTSSYPIYITHTKPAETALIMSEIAELERQREAAGKPARRVQWLAAGQEFEI